MTPNSISYDGGEGKAPVDLLTPRREGPFTHVRNALHSGFCDPSTGSMRRRATPTNELSFSFTSVDSAWTLESLSRPVVDKVKRVAQEGFCFPPIPEMVTSPKTDQTHNMSALMRSFDEDIVPSGSFERELFDVDEGDEGGVTVDGPDDQQKESLERTLFDADEGDACILDSDDMQKESLERKLFDVDLDKAAECAVDSADTVHKQRGLFGVLGDGIVESDNGPKKSLTSELVDAPVNKGEQCAIKTRPVGPGSGLNGGMRVLRGLKMLFFAILVVVGILYALEQVALNVDIPLHRKRVDEASTLFISSAKEHSLGLQRGLVDAKAKALTVFSELEHQFGEGTSRPERVQQEPKDFQSIILRDCAVL